MIKIITGFRNEQYYIIKDDEAHKAYYLFNNPDFRTVFDNGVALIGKNIQGIEPAWNETMGWNPTHTLDDDDWNEIRKSGVESRMRMVQEEGKKVAVQAQADKSLLDKKLSEINLKLK